MCASAASAAILIPMPSAWLTQLLLVVFSMFIVHQLTGRYMAATEWADASDICTQIKTIFTSNLRDFGIPVSMEAVDGKSEATRDIKVPPNLTRRASFHAPSSALYRRGSKILSPISRDLADRGGICTSKSDTNLKGA